MMWIMAGMFAITATVSIVLLGYSPAFIGLYLFGLLFFVIGVFADDQGLI
jgi:hypothetical protein